MAFFRSEPKEESACRQGSHLASLQTREEEHGGICGNEQEVVSTRGRVSYREPVQEELSIVDILPVIRSLYSPSSCMVV